MDLRTRRKRIRYKFRFSNKMRLSVHKSNQYTYAQLINPQNGNVLASYDTKRLIKDNPDAKKEPGVKKAYLVGKRLGEQIKSLGINDIIFDRSGYKYHGKVKALAEGLREAGLKF